MDGEAPAHSPHVEIIFYDSKFIILSYDNWPYKDSSCFLSL